MRLLLRNFPGHFQLPTRYIKMFRVILRKNGTIVKIDWNWMVISIN